MRIQNLNAIFARARGSPLYLNQYIGAITQLEALFVDGVLIKFGIQSLEEEDKGLPYLTYVMGGMSQRK